MTSNIIVLKFGGTSQVQTTYDLILNRVKSCDKKKYIIVLSAISGITNKLLQYTETKNKTILQNIVETNKRLAHECNVNIDDIINNILTISSNLKTTDDMTLFISQGEFMTCHILNRFLAINNINSLFVSSLDVIYSNQENITLYNKGEFEVDYSKILDILNTKDVVVIPGFSGRTPSNKCCLLGRGGSDTSGSIIASAVDAKSYEIWTDVHGIYTSDPRKIYNALINCVISYDAAQELAAMGAKVIHPYCILPCARKEIPIKICNTFDPNSWSTIIRNCKEEYIYGITIQDNVKVFKITSLNMWNNYGFVYDIFSIFKEFNVDVNIINTSQFNITTTTDEINELKLLDIKTKLEQKYQVELKFKNSIVSVVGDNIRMVKNIGELFNVTKEFDIITTSYSSNDLSLSFVISSDNAINLAQELHNKIF